MPGGFDLRGIVEGFYGPPWTHAARLDALSFAGERGMNAYMYAPKDEPKHRQRWREPYDGDEVGKFAALDAHARACGVRFGFAISPGLDIDYDDGDDRRALLAKLRQLLDCGVEWFLLALDDIPLRPGLAGDQAALTAWLLAALRGERPDVALTLCPTEYVGTRPTPYLRGLAGGLAAGGGDIDIDVDVMWTGPTVCSPAIDAGQAAAWSEALGGRRVLLWDNYPVNDGMMADRLHLGPYRGRDPALAGVLSGVLCNPMVQPYASGVALATAAEFLADPEAYDPDAAWARAIDAVGGEAAAPLARLARACADGPLAPPETLPLADLVHLLAEEIEGPGWAPVLAAAAAELEGARALPDAFPAGGGGLAAEVAPWAGAAASEAGAGLAALHLLQMLRPVGRIDPGGRGLAAAPDATAAMQQAFVLAFTWAAARGRPGPVAFGPRFAVYPAVVQLADGAPGLDVSLAVVEDANAVDACCRLALDAYDRWAAGRGDPLRVFVDGDERPIDEDGAFDGRGTMALLRAGPLATRLDPTTVFPFPDARLR